MATPSRTTSTYRHERYSPTLRGRVVDLWDAAIGPAFPLRDTVLAGRLQDRRGVRPTILAELIWLDERLVAFAYVTTRDRAIKGSTHMRLQAVLVHPEHRREGIGRRLVRSLLADGETLGGRSAEVGGGSDYLWPAIPESLPGAEPFFAASGFALGGLSHDLRSSNSTLAASRAAASGLTELHVTVRPASRTDVPDLLAFVGGTFDVEWQVDIVDDIAAGGRPDHYLLATGPDRDLIGFVRIHTPASEPAGPPLFWAGRRSAGAGGLGPIGIATAWRGRGLGRALLGASVLELERLGCRDVVIDFTDQLAFYGRLGFQPWMTFRHATWPGTLPSADVMR